MRAGGEEGLEGLQPGGRWGNRERREKRQGEEAGH